MKRIFLIGYMGAGKSTFGRQIAKSMGLSFIDMDEFIETRYQKTINQLFADKGEVEFRKLEHNVLVEISDYEDVIISTGGGTPCFFDNMSIMNRLGTTVYLKSEPQYLVQRIKRFSNKRPLIKGKNEQELFSFVKENLQKREIFYEQAVIIFEICEILNREGIDLYAGLLEKRLNEGL